MTRHVYEHGNCIVCMLWRGAHLNFGPFVFLLIHAQVGNEHILPGCGHAEEEEEDRVLGWALSLKCIV